MSGQGEFIARWPFKCEGCKKKVERGQTGFYTFVHSKKVCYECAVQMIEEIRGHTCE